MAHRRAEGCVFLALALAGTIALTYLVKDLVDRSRPAFHLVETDSASFPSAHSADSLAAFGADAFVLKRRRAKSGPPVDLQSDELERLEMCPATIEFPS